MRYSVVDFQATGGRNNKGGNRYEDFFATHRFLIHTPSFLSTGSQMRLKEQANCPVDDIVLELQDCREYYQLKADKAITWGEDGGRLGNNFLAQQAKCQKGGQSFKLFVVVADEPRKKSLEKNLPSDLQDNTKILLFPRLVRVSELARLEEPHRVSFSAIAASRKGGNAEWEDLAEAFHSARVNCEADGEGFIPINNVIEKIRKQGWARIYTPWSESLDGWPEAKQILQQVPGFQFWVDRGYFEWEYPPADSGLSVSCQSDGFERFIRRVVEVQPKTFEDLEVLFP